MVKTILVSVLGAVLVVALGAGAYYMLTHSESALAAMESGSSSTSLATADEAVLQAQNASVVPAPANIATQTNVHAQGSGNGNGKRYGSSAANQSNAQNAPAPQADLSQAVTIQGFVVKYEYGTLTLQTERGELIAIQVGNQNYLRQINFTPITGETLSIVAFPGEQGLLTAVSVTRLSDGSVYQLRDSTISRPLWTGGGWGKRVGSQP